MIVTDGFIKSLVDCDAAAGGVILALCTGNKPTLEQLRKDYAVVDRLYFQGPTEPTLRTIVPKLGGDIVTRAYWSTLMPTVGRGSVKFPLSTTAVATPGFVFQDATPTWAMLMWGRGCVTNSVAIWNVVNTAAHAACFNLAILSVGDENSSADIKIKGGKVFAGSLFKPADIEIKYAGDNVVC
jgi:hypothetical protein